MNEAFVSDGRWFVERDDMVIPRHDDIRDGDPTMAFVRLSISILS